jgi:hypothetical protein
MNNTHQPRAYEMSSFLILNIYTTDICGISFRSSNIYRSAFMLLIEIFWLYQIWARFTDISDTTVSVSSDQLLIVFLWFGMIIGPIIQHLNYCLVILSLFYKVLLSLILFGKIYIVYFKLSL